MTAVERQRLFVSTADILPGKDVPVIFFGDRQGTAQLAQIAVSQFQDHNPYSRVLAMPSFRAVLVQ